MGTQMVTCLYGELPFPDMAMTPESQRSTVLEVGDEKEQTPKLGKKN